VNSTTQIYSPYAALSQFYRAFSASTDIRLWCKLVKEETVELKEAMLKGDRAEILKEFCDVIYVVVGMEMAAPEDADLLIPEEELGELNAILKAADEAIGFAKQHAGFSADVIAKAFTRVHASNMSKLGEDGKPIRREDGKIMKGPNYIKPDLSDLV
jgi:predicted HAD superfamily Cof-like phosphohydrolase